MAYSLVAKATSTGNANSATTSAINTTGANLIVLGVGSFSFTGEPTLSDSKGNTWTGLTARTSGNARLRIFYCISPTVGSGHTFSTSGTSSLSGIVVQAWSGGATPAFDAQSGAAGVQPGSISPAEDNELLVVFGASDDPLQTRFPTGINSDFQVADIGSGILGSLASAYQIQTTATARNPSWTPAGSVDVSAMAAFKGGGAASSGSPWYYYAQLRVRSNLNKFFRPLIRPKPRLVLGHA